MRKRAGFVGLVVGPMTSYSPPGSNSAAPAGDAPVGHTSGDFSRARDAEDDHVQRSRVHAARTVACNAHDAEDLQLLLSILGLDASPPADDQDLGPRYAPRSR